MELKELNKRGINILEQFEGMDGREIMGTFASIAYHICKSTKTEPSEFASSFTVALAMITADNEADEEEKPKTNQKLS